MCTGKIKDKKINIREKTDNITLIKLLKFSAFIS